MRELTNAIYLPYHLAADVLDERAPRLQPAPECPDDKIYWVDSEGNVHYFQYMGKNLMRLQGEDLFDQLLDDIGEDEDEI